MKVSKTDNRSETGFQQPKLPKKHINIPNLFMYNFIPYHTQEEQRTETRRNLEEPGPASGVIAANSLCPT